MRLGRRVDAHALHKLLEAGLFAVCATAFGSFDGVKELATFAATVLNKRLHILLQAFDRILHLRVELACSFEACDKIDVCLVDFAVAAENRVALAGKGLVFVLFGADAFVLQKVAVCACELLHDRRLLVDCLQNAVLMRSELFEFRLEELVLLTGRGFLVQDEDVADIVGVNLDMLAIFKNKSKDFLPSLSDLSALAASPSSRVATS